MRSRWLGVGRVPELEPALPRLDAEAAEAPDDMEGWKGLLRS